MGVVALVLALHTALLGLWPVGSGIATHADAPRSLRVRQIVQAQPATPSVPLPGERRNTAKAAPAPNAQAAVDAKPAPAENPPTGEAAEAAAEPGSAETPVYATSLPSSMTLRYALKRGANQGTAELRWVLQGEHYQLSLQSEMRGLQALGSASVGAIDANGLAPERHTESRRRRDVRAVNFQRDSARITFSGPRAEYPLQPGVQDRLSWMLQLGAIVEANPALRLAGSEISIFVVGSRGDAQTWVFTVVDNAPVDTGLGEVAAALHLKREPRRPYDTEVDVWLDPTRGHLPARLRLQPRPGGEGTEFVLQGVDSP